MKMWEAIRLKNRRQKPKDHILLNEEKNMMYILYSKVMK